MIDFTPVVLILAAFVLAALGMLMLSHYRMNTWVDDLVKVNAKMRVNSNVPAEYGAGAGHRFKGDNFMIIRHADTHGNVWCMGLEKGDHFIIRTTAFKEALTEGRIERI